jgi:hypothetical protein
MTFEEAAALNEEVSDEEHWLLKGIQILSQYHEIDLGLLC